MENDEAGSYPASHVKLLMSVCYLPNFAFICSYFTVSPVLA